MSNAGTLRRQLDEGWILAAGCFDALSARLAEHVGFRSLHVTGLGVEATQLGAPDMGLITSSELAAHVARITAAVGAPAIVDIDTGFGGTDNVMRTVRLLEQAGAGGVHIEDQTFPKRCPALGDRQVLPLEDAVARVRAAVAARTDQDFVIVARTDADVVSFEELVNRSNEYLRAGADVAMPLLMELDGQPFSDLAPDAQMEWYRRLVKEVDGPLLCTVIPEGYTAAAIRDAGFAICILPTVALRAATTAMVQALREALEDGVARSYFTDHPAEFASTMEFFEVLHVQDYLANQERFGSGRPRSDS